MTEVQQLAGFMVGTHDDQLSAEAAEQLKIRVAIGALDAEPLIAIRGLTAGTAPTAMPAQDREPPEQR